MREPSYCWHSLESNKKSVFHCNKKTFCFKARNFKYNIQKNYRIQTGVYKHTIPWYTACDTRVMRSLRVSEVTML